MAAGRKRDGLARDELEALVEQGLTIREIAAAVDRCTLTVQRWLARYGLKTHAARRIAGQRAARAAGRETITGTCRRHGSTDFVIDGAGYYRCRRCRVESVTRRRRKVKELLAREAGGRCCVCGYDRYIGALEFHHVDPQQKRLGLALGGITLALDRLREEVRKCVLLCSNCHAEVEGGVTSLPIE